MRVVVSDPDYYLKIFDLFCDIILGTINLQVGSNARNLSIHHRFYVALALNDLVNEVPLSKVAKKYDASKGMLQGLQQTVSSFAGMVSNDGIDGIFFREINTKYFFFGKINSKSVFLSMQ